MPRTVEEIEAELDTIPINEANYPIELSHRQIDAWNTRKQHLGVWASVARQYGPKIPLISASLDNWRAHLDALKTVIDPALVADLLSIKSPIRDGATKERQTKLVISLKMLRTGHGLEEMENHLWTREQLPFFQLLREHNLDWRGPVPVVNAQIALLEAELAEAQIRLHDALMTDDERAAAAAELKRRIKNEFNLKTRADGSTYRRYRDGRPDEEEAPPKWTSEQMAMGAADDPPINPNW